MLKVNFVFFIFLCAVNRSCALHDREFELMRGENEIV